MKRNLAKWMVWATTVTVAGVLLSGCAWSIGGTKEHAAAVQTTRGQELIDLKKARDQGAITPDEYEAQKKKIMER